MNLLKDESVITSSDNNRLILTTHRIRYDSGDNNDGTITSMMLQHVSSVQLISRSYPVLILIGILLIAGGFAVGNGNNNASGEGALIVIGFIVGIAYFFTKQHTCIITSDGSSKIVFSTTNMKRASLLEFMDKIEEAQLKRMAV